MLFNGRRSVFGMCRWRIEPVAIGAVPLIGVLLVVALGGCFEKDEREPVPTLPADEATSPVDGKRASRAAERCDWGRTRRIPDSTVRSTFVDTGQEGARLLLERAAVRPGAILSIAVENDTAEAVRYGTYAYARDSSTGREVESDGPYAYRAIGLYAEPGEVGPCVQIVIPSDTPAGDYRAVLGHVDASRNGGTTLEADFLVRGEPIEDPRWERQLDQASG